MAKDFSVVVNIGGRVAASLPAAIKSAEGRLTGLSNHFKAQAAAQKAAIRGMIDSFKGAVALVGAGGMIFSIKKMLGDGEELAHELQVLRNAGRTTKEVAEGIAAANKSIRDMPTASLAGSIKLLNETTGAFGDYKHAVENLDFNSKLATVLKNATGSEDPEHDVGSLIKALEIRGSAGDPAKYRREAGELQRAMTFYGTRLKADDIYTFASNAPVGVKQLNERFLTKIAPSLIQEMGGDKAGTGLTAFRTIISGRKITDKKQAEAWQKLGLLNQKDVIKNKLGDVTGWKDGAIKDTALAYQDPLAFIEGDILPRLQQQGTDIADPIKLGAALNTLFKNTKANAFVTAISTVLDRTRLKKDEALINKVLDLDKNYDESLLNDPKLAKFAIVQAMKNIGASLSLPMMKPLAEMLISISRAMNQLSASLMEHPGAARVLSGIGAALAAMAAIRLANLVFGISGLARAIVLLGTASTLGLAARLVAIARGIAALSVAAAVGIIGRVRALAAGLMLLSSVPAALAIRLRATALAIMMLGFGGTVRASLGVLAGGLASLGMSVLRFPLVALRGIGLAMWGLLANPVALAVTAVVVALTALGIWVSNNWNGLKAFFTAFGESFMHSLGPGAAGAVTSIVDSLRSVYDWVQNLLGPIDETGVKWAQLGTNAGAAVASMVNALADLPSKVAAVAVSTGKAIVDGIVTGIKSASGAITGAITGAVSGAGGWLAGKLGIGGAPAAPDAPGVAGARAMGGSVAAGLPYLVGERGPEIFVPTAAGSIKTNGYLNGLGGVGGPSVDVSALNQTGSAARQTGAVLHASLDATRKPIVDTSSIDEATEKASKLSTILASIGNSSIDVGGIGGGGGSGGGGGPWNGKANPVGSGAGIGHTASQAERAAFIKSYAASIGMSPAVALRVAQSEGFSKYTGDQGRSFGDFQLFTGGGVGNRALKAGINVRDPRQWQAADKYALDVAKREGWSAWHGARRVGIGNWQGIRGARAMGGPVSAGGSYLVGERGPEIFTPGLSGGISTNDVLRTLKEGDGSFVPSAGAVAKHRPQKGSSSVRGDTHISNQWHIHEANNPAAVQRQVSACFADFVRQAESEQRGLLSD